MGPFFLESLNDAIVLPPGQSGFIRHCRDGHGEADPHMGDRAALFRTFTHTPTKPR